MSGMIRPEAIAAIRRWSEVLTGAGIALLGLWLFTRGGWFFGGLGALLTLAGLGWALVGLRRMRFHQDSLGEGVVDVLEGQVTYLSPTAFGGGFVSITEITEIRLLRVRGARLWRLSQPGRAPLLIPVDALGADRLFDAFVSLPGLSMPLLLDVLEDARGADRLIWERPRHRVAGPPRAGGDAK